MHLRKRRDQAKKDFLQDRRSGHFIADTRYDGWEYVSYQEHSAVARTQREDNANPIVGGPRSLGYLPADQPSRYYQHGPSLVSDQGMTDRGGRGSDQTRERNLWRKSAIGVEEEEMDGGVVYKDFGLVDNLRQFENKCKVTNQKKDR